MKDVQIIDISYTVGEIKLDSEDIAKKFKLDPEKLNKLTGISILRLFDKSKGNIVDRLVHLIEETLTRNSLKKSDISGIFGSSNQIGATLMPTVTTTVAVKAGFKNIIPDHVGIGCAGGVQAVRAAYNQIHQDLRDFGESSYYLVIGGEDTGVTVNQNDYKTASLFSDACYVLLLTNDESKSGRTIEYVRSMSLLGEEALTCMSIDNYLHSGNVESQRFVMDGKKVQLFARKLWFYIQQLTRKKFTENELREMYLIPHQANLRIIEMIMKRYDLNPELVHAEGIKKYGNTSNASAFIGLANSFHKKEKLLVAPFGAELQVGMIVIS